MCKVLSFVFNPRIFIITRIHGVFEADNYDNDLVIGIGYKAIIFIEERDPNDATEFDDNEFVSAISEIEYDYDEDEEEDDEESGRSVPEGPLGQFLATIDPDTLLGQFLKRAWIKTEINLLGRNLRLGLAFLNVG